MKRGLVFLGICSLFSSIAFSADDLAANFVTPPRSARPHTWYHMMNGNVTKAGITRDFEALAKAGIGGVQMFDAGCDIPPGGLDFNSPEWFDLLRHAAAEARRLGLEICIPNCSGWSSSGGPWNPPSNSMKRVVFTETTVTGPKKFVAKLPREMKDNGYYADIATLAFPAPAAEVNMPHVPAAQLETTLTVTPDAAAKLSDGLKHLVLNIPRKDKKAHTFILRYAKAVTTSCFAFQIAGGDSWSETIGLKVESAMDDKVFQPILERKIMLSQSGAHDVSMRRLALPQACTFRSLRVSLTIAPAGKRGTHFQIGEFAPVWGRRLSGVPAKTFDLRQPVEEETIPAQPDQVVARDKIVDVSSHLAPDGTLTWEVPAGTWRIMRVGCISNGRCNHPASDHGKGLEVDKLSAEAMDFHFEQYVARIVKHLGPLAGDVGFNNILVDSYEVGSQNWTQKMPAEFRARRGYDLTYYLPTFAGYVVDSIDESERFLEDFRRTVADLFAENYAGALTKKCHQYGLKCSIEPYGNCPADNLQYGEYADIPMGEFWSHARDPYGLGCGNSKFVSHITHVWGKKYCGTESFTASPSVGSGRWMTTPFSIKAQGDSAFANGVNRIIYHRYTHQPWTDDKYLPGMTMGRWGMHLDRTQTWWEFAEPWFKYQARCQYLLQEGVFRADVLFFAGEHAPNQGGNTDGGANAAAFYKLPEGYDYDICPTDAMYALKVVDGCVVVPGGVKYRLLALPQMEACSPEMVQCVLNLREKGATIVWPKKPVRAPGRKWGAAGDAKVCALAQQLWGKGVLECTPAEALAKLAIKPDVTVESKLTKEVKKLEWIHRGTADSEWYFMAMPNRGEETVEVSFRQTGRCPEIWDAQSGTCGPADVWREEGDRTYVTIPFTTCGSKFVVFRKPSSKTHITACAITATPRPDPVSASNISHTLVITEALYGLPATKGRENCADVSMCIRPGLKTPVTNTAMGGDPASMRVKELEVVYELNGVKKRDIAREHTAYTLPVGAKLISAWYGVIDPNWKPDEGHLIDVTAKLAALVKDGQVSVRVNNSIAGRDPIFGVVKKLQVKYLYDGEEKTCAASEGQTFSIPQGVEAPVPPAHAEWREGVLYAFQPLVANVRYSTGEAKNLKATPPPAVPIAGAWDVCFPNHFLPNKLAVGEDEKVNFPELISWSASANKGVKYFSGTATYSKTLAAQSVKSLLENKGNRVILDLGTVKHFAEVTVNGKTYPVLWKPPFRLDITNAIKPGEPVALSIRVANLWANRLIGDDREYEEDCIWKGTVRNGVKEIGIREIPGWVKQGQKSPTGRCTFTTWKHWDKNDELLPSGLLGPVLIRAAVPCVAQ